MLSGFTINQVKKKEKERKAYGRAKREARSAPSKLSYLIFNTKDFTFIRRPDNAPPRTIPNAIRKAVRA